MGIRVCERASSYGWGLFSLVGMLVVTSQTVCGGAPRFFTYVGSLSDHSAIVAWGTTTGSGNTIGRDSASHGKAVVEIGTHQIEENARNWVEVRGLVADTTYGYKVTVAGRVVGSGQFRTWATTADKLAFFVIGDFGNASAAQNRIAKAMAEEFQRRAGGEYPVRFVLTVGDNIYGFTARLVTFRTGARDADWQEKFFAPYEQLLRSIPFYPTLGNHDGNESEAQADLGVYLDNFFFPEAGPHRYYRFSYGGLAEFFALDSSQNTASGGPRPQYLEGGEQYKWLKGAMAAPAVGLWRFGYFHHPPFTAGPLHTASLGELRPLLGLLERGGVQAVFNGHEHNFQFTTQGAETGGIQYFLSGAGGELRRGDVTSRMKAAHVAGWAAAHNFLVVEVDRGEMRVSPVSWEAVRVTDEKGGTVAMPLRVPVTRGK
ncbi:MAG: metallophosphoesterase [Bryobacteraceae bacterium]